MRMKLVWLFGMVVLAFVGLGIRITVINASQGNQYSKQVLSQSQQKYDSRVIPFKRGDITDRNGVVLATSEKVYKVILDCKVVNTKEEYVEPTIKALVDVMGLDEETVRKKLEDETTKDSQYQILQSNVSINQKKAFEDYTDVSGEEAKEKLTKEEIAERSNIKGVWFEEDYRRVYPLNSTASHLVGFTYTGNSADWGIEGYYSSTLNGVNGRQFGYYNSDADVEQNIIDPINGNSVESTIDLNIQQVVEKYISNFMDGMANGPRGAEGAANVGVIVANPKNGEILAMATDNPYDLNDPRDLTSYYSQDEINGMDNDTMLENLYGIWKNYCISDAFEPGSTVKPLTIGAALDADVVQPSDTFVCDGYQMFGGTRIRCIIYPGAHGTETLSDLIKHSCNDGLMQIGALLGSEEFLKYQKIFNFGATTGIDLPGEATGILHTEESLSSGSTELASASFGQGYTCTMIQEIAAICSVINGGYYYQPHVVSKILNEDGDVIKDVQPVVTKQTVSSDVSALIRQYMGTVMESDGTGAAAKVDGYSMGGKTGTAQKYPREEKKYLVSFIGFAPLDDPQVVVYVVVDEPNTEYQADSLYAQYIYKGVMTEILPYLNIFQDEEVTDKANAKMTYLENLINQKAESNRQSDSTDDTTTAAPPEDDSETKLDNKQESEGITDEEAAIQSGN
ncbi:peptidoglycan D,D-transpeptidase FtsI family protein [Oliverpabstia sp.]|uniref:peptidoglycan D,D-transpeptidase FtsI family protein n=1 Tax=Oliverpabstia sp. TaxID=2815798 RepID=UPI0025839B47|nr:penicillin-binding transpeptidase domain-containing protein [Oliverpabstia sp.]MCI7526327.1 cell division protein FtsI [Oliverpabstia sp.]